MNIVLAHSFFMELDAKQKAIQEPFPPLGTIIAASMLREKGAEVQLFDAMLAKDPKEIEPFLVNHPDWVVFFEDNFNWLSKMCLENMREACFTMIDFCKQANVPCIVVGSDASDFPQVYLERGANYVIKGEAEWRLLDLLFADKKGAGVFQLQDGLVMGAPPDRPVHDLSQFPAPAWDLVNMAAYRKLWQQGGRPFRINMMTTRGCPYRCNWCAKPIHGRRYDIRPAQDVVQEMIELQEKYGVESIWFADDIFGLNPKWLQSFADLVNKPIPYKIQARADLISESYADLLAQSGCEEVWLGAESGSQKILNAMDKDTTVAQIEQAAQRLKVRGIKPCFFIQFGYIGEDASDIQATWDLIDRAQPHAIGISVAYPLPHTPFYDKVKDVLVPQDHWAHSDFMRPVFRATFPADFYPLLYRFTHLVFYESKNGQTWRSKLRKWLVARKMKRLGFEAVS